MLTALLGKKKIERLYEKFYDVTLENVRLIGETSYAPSLALYEKYKDEEWGIISIGVNDTTHIISKPEIPDGDEISFENGSKDSTGILLSGNLVIYLDNGSRYETDYEGIVSELILLINYGISKLENKLLGTIREIYSDKLINDQYQINIRSVKISVDQYGELKVNYEVFIIDEAALRPPKQEEDSDEEAGGREYKRIRDETLLKTKKKKQ